MKVSSLDLDKNFFVNKDFPVKGFQSLYQGLGNVDKRLELWVPDCNEVARDHCK